MPEFSPRNRISIANAIREEVPSSWRVVPGRRGTKTVEVDQDGERPDYRFPEVGTQVIVVEQVGVKVRAVAYERVKCPSGYTEARKKLRVLTTQEGRGWLERLAKAVGRHTHRVEGSYGSITEAAASPNGSE